MTKGDQVRAMTNEELAEYFAAKETALTDMIFQSVQEQMRKKGYKIDFLKRFHPQLLKQKEWWLHQFEMEADTDAEPN